MDKTGLQPITKKVNGKRNIVTIALVVRHKILLIFFSMLLIARVPWIYRFVFCVQKYKIHRSY